MAITPPEEEKRNKDNNRNETRKRDGMIGVRCFFLFSLPFSLCRMLPQAEIELMNFDSFFSFIKSAFFLSFSILLASYIFHKRRIVKRTNQWELNNFLFDIIDVFVCVCALFSFLLCVFFLVHSIVFVFCGWLLKVLFGFEMKNIFSSFQFTFFCPKARFVKKKRLYCVYKIYFFLLWIKGKFVCLEF